MKKERFHEALQKWLLLRPWHEQLCDKKQRSKIKAKLKLKAENNKMTSAK